jgi:hypothetical protein
LSTGIERGGIKNGMVEMQVKSSSLPRKKQVLRYKLENMGKFLTFDRERLEWVLEFINRLPPSVVDTTT